MTQTDVFAFIVEENSMGIRLDTVVAECVKSCSRSLAVKLINDGHVKVDGLSKKPGYRVKEGERITGVIPNPEPVAIEPEPLDLNIIHEDSDLIVLNKPAGMVVHPAPGNYTGTIVNAILHHCRDIQGIGGDIRPGIVHRLDKNTSGVMVIAKNDLAHYHLSAQFKSRETKKKYLAIVHGNMKSEQGEIHLPIGRHLSDRKKMSTSGVHSREAVTLWQVKERFIAANLLELRIKTGRTHQIRVHCLSMHHPVVGDDVYKFKNWEKQSATPQSANAREVVSVLSGVKRQMLHAFRLEFRHPQTNGFCRFEAPLPGDMQKTIEWLRELSEKS